jgi:DNA polymerase-3 subunit beta
MKTSVLQENLARGLNIVSRAIGSRPTLPVLANVLITAQDGRLRLSTTNLEIALIARVGAKVDDEGAITVPMRTFQEFVNALPPERIDLALDAKTNTLKVTCGKATSNIRGIPADDYPALNEAPINDGIPAGIAVPAAALQEMIGHVVFSAAKEDNRPVLTGIMTRFEGDTLTMAAADGYRLTVRTLQLDQPIDAPLSMVIPARTLTELARIIAPDDVNVWLSFPQGRNQIVFHLDRTDMSSQLIEGQYPAIESIIPKTFTTQAAINRESLLRAARRAEIFARDAAYTTRFSILPGENGDIGSLKVTAQSQETGDNEGIIDADANGLPIEMAFNIRYVIDLLSAVKDEMVILECTTPDKPGTLRLWKRADFIHVIMPMATNLR